MKIGFFTDSHYSSKEVTCGKRYNSRSLEKIKQAYFFFEKEKCDLVVCLGDLIDRESNHEKEVENLKKIADIIRQVPLETVCLMGNHDAFAFTPNEFYDILGIKNRKSLEFKNKSLIFIDACYFKNQRHYMPGDSDWTDTFYPFTAELKKQLDRSSDEVYIFIHQNLDPLIREDHRVYNAEDINFILYESKKVKAVYQGHYHSGKESLHNGIKYLTFPAMCEGEKAYFIEEI